jgi:integrase
VKNPRRCFTVDEIRQVITAAKEPYKTMFWVLAETGIRGGELCGLQVDDLDLDHSLLYVRRSAWRAHLQTPKTANAIRRVTLSDALVAHLREYLKTTWRPNKLNMLFSTRTGRPCDNSELSRNGLRPILESLALPGGGLHAFRHGNATLLVSEGVDIKTVQSRLGHAQASMTLGIYTHPVEAKQHELVNKIAGVLFPNCSQPLSPTEATA